MEELKPAEFIRTINVSDDHIRDNIKAALERKLPLYWDRPCVIVGGGPSLADHEQDLKDDLGWIDAPASVQPKFKKTVYALNNTHDWLIERRIIPDYLVMMDARPENAEFVRNWHPDVTYLIASQCPAEVFDALKGARVKVWHAHGEAAAEHIKGQPMIVGGGTVVSRATNIAYDMGHRQITLYGADSSYRGDTHHAYDQKLNDGQTVHEFIMNGNTYFTTGAFGAQAQDFLIQARNLTNMKVHIEFKGDGLLPDMWRADLADREGKTIEERERDKYRRMWAHDVYRKYSPGEVSLPHAIQAMEPPRGATIVDFGCGTGRATKRLANAGYQATGVDFAPEALDDDVVGSFKFVESNLWELPETLKGDYGFCCDVMEHIPPPKVHDVLRNIRGATIHDTYFRIAFDRDVLGSVIGERLHMTVKPEGWWRAQLNEVWCDVKSLGQGQFLCKGNAKWT